MFYVEDLANDPVTLDESETRHALGSRRLRDGETVTLFDGRGQRADGVIAVRTSGRRRTVEVRITQRHQLPPPGPGLHVFTAAPKGDRLRFLVEKCTELGAAGVHIVRWHRSVAEPSRAGRDKLHRIAIEACKQCERLWLPEITVNGGIQDFCRAPATRFYANREPAAQTLPATRTADIAIAIGPEGGFTREELDQFQAAGANALRLGEHILRTETAAVAAAALTVSK